MKIKEKSLQNNALLFIIALDIFYVILFYVFLLVNFDLPLTIRSVISFTVENKSLLLVILHPLLLLLGMYLFLLRYRNYIKKITEEKTAQNKKVELVYTFVEKLRSGEGNIKVFDEKLQQNKLVKSLLNLSQELEKTRKEDDLRKKEEEQRHWTNEGLAKFGAILRENVEDLEKLTSEITSHLTRYLNSQQAGFFVLKEENGEKIFDMTSLFAFERKKFADKKFKWGEGLIGASAIEQKTIFLKNTSNTFVDITSGLGKANPRSILIVPIKDNENIVHGVLEIASFKIFENFEVSFIEQVAESIGLTMATIKTSLRTQELLKESQKQAEMLAQQEETRRQNIEEIEQDREKTKKQFLSLQEFHNSLLGVVYQIDINTEGRIIGNNDNILKLLNYTDKNQLIDTEFVQIMQHSDREWFAKIFKEMINDKNVRNYELKFVDKQEKIFLMLCYFVPVTIDDRLEKISVLSINLSEKENIIIKEQQQLNALLSITYKADIKPDGYIEFASENLLNAAGYSNAEIKDLKIFDFIIEERKEQFHIIWKNILKGKKYQEQGRFVKKNAGILNVDFIFTPIFDINNNIIKINFVATDITENEKNKQKIKETSDEKIKIENKINEINDKFAIEKQKQQTETETLKSNINLLESFFTNAEDAIVIIQNQKIITYNQKAEEIWGYEKNTTIGKKIDLLLPKKSTEENYLLNHINNNNHNKPTFIINKNNENKKIIATTQKYKHNNTEIISIIAQIDK